MMCYSIHLELWEISHSFAARTLRTSTWWAAGNTVESCGKDAEIILII